MAQYNVVYLCRSYFVERYYIAVVILQSTGLIVLMQEGASRMQVARLVEVFGGSFGYKGSCFVGVIFLALDTGRWEVIDELP